MPVPAIAIHASGPGHEIAKAVDANFAASAMYDRVVTLAFDWDKVVPQSSYKGPRNLYRFLKRSAGTIGAASRVGLEFGVHPLDRSLGGLQVRLHRLTQGVLAALVGIVLAMLVAELVVLEPAARVGLPTATFLPMGWMETAAGWSKVAIGVGATLLMVLGILRLLLTMSPRPVIVAFRSIVFLLLQPVLVVLLGALAADWWLLLTVFAVLAASSYLASGIGAALLWILVLGGLVGMRGLWARKTLRGPIKVALDGFRYLGEPRYRERVQVALDNAIIQARSRVENDDDFVLVGQGIGTVMALDSLTHSRLWRDTDRVLLVTMGSPLRRWFLSLYPRTLFPESMENVIGLAARRLADFLWVNIYRPWDYLGSDLGLKRFKGRDISTGIGERRAVGHGDYWQDRDAQRTFGHGLQRLKKVQPVAVSRKEEIHGMPEPRSAAGALRIPSRLQALLKPAFVLATLGWMLWWVATGAGVLTTGIEGTSELLEQRGFTVEAAASHRREIMENERGVTYVDYWMFAFADSSGVDRRVRVVRDASEAYLGVPTHRFDHRALTREIRAGCGGIGLPQWWPMGDMEARCTLEGVRLRYYSGDLSVLDLPDYPQRQFGSDPVRGWAEAGAVAAVLSVLFVIPVVLGVRLFGMLLG
jgi:hypothetical protein